MPEDEYKPLSRGDYSPENVKEEVVEDKTLSLAARIGRHASRPRHSNLICNNLRRYRDSGHARVRDVKFHG